MTRTSNIKSAVRRKLFTVLRRPYVAGDSRHHSFYRAGLGEPLPRIAHQVYQDADLWPIIFDANSPLLGEEPINLKPSQWLQIPELGRLLPDQVEEARTLARSWQQLFRMAELT